MIKTIEVLLYEYRNYSNIYNKISYEENKNNLIKLKRGLYETSKDASPYTIANALFSRKIPIHLLGKWGLFFSMGVFLC